MDKIISTPSKRATLGMVAEKAGVSPSTVSRILNGTAQVSEEKKALVQTVIKELGFRPDPAARSLAGGRTMSIGVLTQFIDSPYYGEALRGIEDELNKAHYAPLFVSGHWNESEEQKQIQLLLDRKVDGIIILTGKLSDATLSKLAQTIPVVVTGRQLSGDNIFSIDFDNAEGAAQAVRHLNELGHRKVAFLSGPLDHPDAKQRLQGYKKELKRLKMSTDKDLIIESDFLETGGLRSVNSLLANKIEFTAIIAANDQMAYGARLALHKAGLRVPKDVSLIGFDDLPHSAFTLPPLTSVRQSVYEIGVSSAKAMFDLINKKHPPSQLVEAELIVRESTAKCSTK
ncbi:MAG: HTH-type transcriptional repressor PurR [Pseudomonadota bacterium]|jgi:LacI family transcriptional regulator